MESDELARDPLYLEAYKDYIIQLPMCRNNHEFGFMSGIYGYKRISNI